MEKDSFSHILAIEKQIREIKTLHELGRLNFREAKIQIKLLESRLEEALQNLPKEERDHYLHKRKFGPLRP